jgi:hypothetical protein
MSRYKPLSIKEEGIQPYLNRTVKAHYDNDFKKFVIFVISGMSIMSLCQAMNMKSRNQMYYYLRLLKEQHGIERPNKKIESRFRV